MPTLIVVLLERLLKPHNATVYQSRHMRNHRAVRPGGVNANAQTGAVKIRLCLHKGVQAAGTTLVLNHREMNMIQKFFMIKVDGKPVRLSINSKTRQRVVVADALGYDTFKSAEDADKRALLYGLVGHTVTPVAREVVDSTQPA